MGHYMGKSSQYLKQATNLMRVGIKMVLEMDQEESFSIVENLMKAYSLKVSLMDTAYTSIKMATSMMENGKMIKNMEKQYTNSLTQVQKKQDNTSIMNQKVRIFLSPRMENKRL
jgi:xylose isomerase